MKHYPNTIQNDPEEIARFVEEMKMANLITMPFLDSHIDSVESGVFNPVHINGRYYLHLNRTDDQYKAMQSSKKARLVFFDFLCNIPSYWIDKEDGGLATSYYRHLDLFCDINIYEEKEDLAKLLNLFLKKYQPEGGHTPLTIDQAMYQSDFKVLGIVELIPYKQVSKWKLGQNQSVEKRLEIIENLKKRNLENDLRAASEVMRFIERQNKDK